ncbi:MAG: FKBP-type peptidyl-prolyl cis-trans isomerase [Gammaproteobacteria bacterium]|nr:FKBP-type peptidyl-prolyl cis-trans isomerase [Gammaproteobacteria bacterium]
MKHTVARVAVLSVFAATAAQAADIKTDKQKFSYTAGVQVGQSLARDKDSFDVQAFTQAIQDVLKGGQLKLTPEEMQTAMNKYRDEQRKKFESSAAANKKVGDDFLAKNKKDKDVTVTASGLQYKVLKKGSGKQPKETDTVSVHYKGTLTNGKEFDSSYGRGQPTEFPVNGVIKGWGEALQLMHEGDKWQIFVPSELAYGPGGAPGSPIGPNEALVFEVELLAVK